VTIEGFRDGSLRIEVSTEGPDDLVATFEGALGHFEPEKILAPFFHRLHAAMLAGQRRRVVIDVRGLRFMGSASFKHFVTWLKANQAEPAERRYAIHFRLGRAHHWQEVSIHALSHFSSALTWESE
jgi:hypothetical protein